MECDGISQSKYTMEGIYVSCEYTHCVGMLAIVPPQGCEAILIEILQPNRYCLLVKTPSRSQHSGGDNG